jgi:hypothetical protein
MNLPKIMRFASSAVLSVFISSFGVAFAWPPSVGTEELAVWQVAAASLAEENTGKPIKVWYYESDLSSATFVSASMSDPDKTDYCGLNYEDARSMFSQLKEINTVTVVLNADMAEAAGYRLGTKKNQRIPYITLSRVVYDKDHAKAWLAVDLNGQRGGLMRVDKIDGRWQKAARCAGWQTAD